MESEINKKIRELLEMFGIKNNKVIGVWSLIGHLKHLIEEERGDFYKLGKQEARTELLEEIKEMEMPNTGYSLFTDGYQQALFDISEKLNNLKQK